MGLILLPLPLGAGRIQPCLTLGGPGYALHPRRV